MATNVEVRIASTVFRPKQLELPRLMDFMEEKIDEMPQKVVLGKEPVTHEADAYSDYPLTITLEARLTTAERATLYDIEDDGNTVYLLFDLVPQYRCWIEKITPAYRNEESVDAPWRTMIYMVVVDTLALPAIWGPYEPDYIFVAGAGAPHDINYDTLAGAGPYLITQVGKKVVTGREGARHLVRTPDRALHVIYVKELAGRYQVYVAASIDEGVTWINETRISTKAGMNGYDQANPALAVNSQGHLNATWDGRATGYTTVHRVWFALYDGAWNPPVGPLDTGPVGMANFGGDIACICVALNDDLHVVFRSRETAYPNTQIYYVTSTDGGTTFSNAFRISLALGQGSYHLNSPTIAMDTNSHPHVCYDGRNTTYATHDQIWYTTLNGSWSVPINITAVIASNDLGAPEIAVDSDDNLHVSYWDSSVPTQFQVYYSKFDGASWSVPLVISSLPTMSLNQNWYSGIACDGLEVHLLWIGGEVTYGSDRIWHAHYTGSWSWECLQQALVCIYPSQRWSMFHQ